MKNLLLIAIIALASCGGRTETAALTAPAAQSETSASGVYSYRVINTFPHDPAAFTQGLFFEDGVLFESTGQVGTSSIRKVRLEDGEVLQKRDVPPPYFGEGIVAWDGRLMELTWRSQKGFIYNQDSFEPLGEWQYAGEGWGLTRNDTHIIMSDGTPQLRFLDPETLEEDHRLMVTFQGQPLGQLNELEWIEGEVWANVWQTNIIVRINPESGVVTGRINLAGLLTREDIVQHQPDVLNGIAYDAETGRIFVTGKLWPKLFEIELAPL